MHRTEEWPWNSTEVLDTFQALEEGGVALFRCNVGYALVAVEPDAIARIYDLKGRPAHKPCVTLGTLSTLAEISKYPDIRLDLVRDLENESSVGVLTEYAPESKMISRLPQPTHSMFTKDGSIAVFLRQGLFVDALAELARRSSKLIIASSANTSGTGNNTELEQVPKSIRNGVDIVLDGGEIYWSRAEKLGSTVVDLRDLSIMRAAANSHVIVEMVNSYRSNHVELTRA